MSKEFLQNTFGFSCCLYFANLKYFCKVVLLDRIFEYESFADWADQKINEIIVCDSADNNDPL